ncbi:4060_t:CDS:10 [Entrophospora sp. SA101]|nr:4060_t:CDS:10 [Entrophospora sp. SA101]
MPKTKFSAIQNPIYNKENVKSKKKELWPNNVQKAFEEAYIMYSWMNDRETKLIAGKHYGRNELIGLYIKEKTNEIRDRKQVSSHIQVLKRKGLLPKVSSSTMNTIKNQSLLMTNACANFIFNQPGLTTGEHVFIDTKINGFHKINQISINQIPIERSDMIIKLYKESTCHMLFFKVKFHAGQIPDYVKIDNVLNMVSESSTQQVLLQTKIFFKTKEIHIMNTNTENVNNPDTDIMNICIDVMKPDTNTNTIADVMNTNSNIANPNIIMTEKCELLQNALTTTASTFLDSNFNNLFGSCGGGVESQLYQTSSFLPPKSNDRYLQLYAAGNIITGNGNDLSSESDDMIIEKYMNCNDFSNGSKEIETIRSEFDSIIAEVMKESENIVYSLNDQF